MALWRTYIKVTTCNVATRGSKRIELAEPRRDRFSMNFCRNREEKRQTHTQRPLTLVHAWDVNETKTLCLRTRLMRHRGMTSSRSSVKNGCTAVQGSSGQETSALLIELRGRQLAVGAWVFWLYTQM